MPRKPCFYSHILVISVSVLMQFFGSARGQTASIPTPCSTSMINTFTPCMNYITGSSNNGTSPTSDCCNSLRTIITAGIDCACLILTANVPLPTSAAVNRALTISLPSVCNSPGVPIQCKATGAPLPPPGPVLFGPPPPSAKAVGVAAPQAAPSTASLPPAAAPVDGESESKPSSGDQIRTVLNPSGSSPSCTISYTTLMLVSIGMVLLKLY